MADARTREAEQRGEEDEEREEREEVLVRHLAGQAHQIVGPVGGDDGLRHFRHPPRAEPGRD